MRRASTNSIVDLLAGNSGDRNTSRPKARGGNRRNGNRQRQMNRFPRSSLNATTHLRRLFARDVAEVNEKVERTEDEMRPDHVIESHPIGASLIAGALGLFIRLDRQWPWSRSDSDSVSVRHRALKTLV